MPKQKTGDGEPINVRPIKSERAPPPLSAELIAKLQGAVDAAQRNRMAQRRPAPQPTPASQPNRMPRLEQATDPHGNLPNDESELPDGPARSAEK